MENKITNQQFNEDVLGSMDMAYEQLCYLLRDKMNNKTKYVNGKLLKDCFKHFTTIIQGYQYLRPRCLMLDNYSESAEGANNG